MTFPSLRTMSDKHSVLVGAERFLDPKIKPVGYAEKDVTAMAAALVELGYEATNQIVLLNEHATKTNVEYSLRQVLKCARAGDTITLFFSTHGYSSGNDTHLVCYDTRFGDFVLTSVSIESLFRLIKESASKQVTLFLDCCHAGLEFPSGEKGLLSGMELSQVEQFFAETEYRVAFASCKADEKSHWADVLGHGVWTSALLEALTGEAPRILEQRRFLRAAELQDYLSMRVPELLRKTFSEKRVQTPRCFGALTSNFLIGDLGPLLAKRLPPDQESEFPIKNSSFRNVERGGIRELSGFRRGHRVPSYHSTATEAFVENVGAEEVSNKANDLYQQIKEAFGYKRRDIELSEADGGASIIAKDFDVNVHIAQSRSNPAEFILTTEVTKLSESSVVKSDEFNQVFTGEVSTLRIEFTKPKDVPAFIDAVEDAQESLITLLDYEPDYSSCDFKIQDVQARFVLHAKYLDVKIPGGQPRQMVTAVVDGSKKLLRDEQAPKLLES